MTPLARRQKDRRRQARQPLRKYPGPYTSGGIAELWRWHTSALDEELARRQRYFGDPWRQAIEFAMSVDGPPRKMVMIQGVAE